MARTAKGTASSKTSETQWSGPSVSMDAGTMLVIGLVYKSGTVHPDSVVWGPRVLKLVPGSRQSNGDMTIAQYKTRVRRNVTHTPMVTWPSAIVAKGMFCSQVTGVSAKDVGNSRQQDATGSPGTGAAVPTTNPITMHIGAFGSEGPEGDTPGSAGAGHTLGQRVGTTGGAASSNVTIQETYESLTATGDCRASLSGATSRDWANTIIAFEDRQKYTVRQAFERRFNTDPDAYMVVLSMESETPGRHLETRIYPDAFDAMTDDEVTAMMCGTGNWDADQLDGDRDPPPVNSSRATRLATFIDDEIVV